MIDAPTETLHVTNNDTASHRIMAEAGEIEVEPGSTVEIVINQIELDRERLRTFQPAPQVDGDGLPIVSDGPSLIWTFEEN